VHERLDGSEICAVKDKDKWPKAIEIGGITECTLKKIRSYRRELNQQTHNAMETWVNKNITEFVVDNPKRDERLDLENWYIIWLVLFPSVKVPDHPCKFMLNQIFGFKLNKASLRRYCRHLNRRTIASSLSADHTNKGRDGSKYGY
jgi:hypothetical protein